MFSDLILSCPHCQALARMVLPEAVEMPGMITWTDGWQTAPGLARAPRATLCPTCSRAFWIGEANQLGFASREQAPDDPAWATAPILKPLDENGAQQALDEGLGSFTDLELELRVLRWWRGNDPFRCADAELGYQTESAAVENMERMIAMTADGGEDLLLFRAEAQRHLGRFDDLVETLRGVGCSDYWPAKSRLLELAAAGSRKLDVLFLPLEHDPSLEPVA
jgi:hypothetical protein